MQSYKREFIEFMVEAEVLRFGDFTTKSGRQTPFFINTGLYRTGSQLARLGQFYAAALEEHLGDRFDVLFGPAYKGIPLVCTTSIALQAHHGREVSFCFNRKEAKDHGEGGVLVGHTLQAGERVVLVEDVTTAGTSIRETVPLLRHAAPVELAGLIVSVDRMERGQGDESALTELSREFRMPTFAIVTIDEVTEHLAGREVGGRVVLDEETLGRVRAYRETWGARA